MRSNGNRWSALFLIKINRSMRRLFGCAATGCPQWLSYPGRAWCVGRTSNLQPRTRTAREVCHRWTAAKQAMEAYWNIYTHVYELTTNMSRSQEWKLLWISGKYKIPFQDFVVFLVAPPSQPLKSFFYAYILCTLCNFKSYGVPGNTSSFKTKRETFQNKDVCLFIKEYL